MGGLRHVTSHMPKRHVDRQTPPPHSQLLPFFAQKLPHRLSLLWLPLSVTRDSSSGGVCVPVTARQRLSATLDSMHLDRPSGRRSTFPSASASHGSHPGEGLCTHATKEINMFFPETSIKSQKGIFHRRHTKTHNNIIEY